VSLKKGGLNLCHPYPYTLQSSSCDAPLLSGAQNNGSAVESATSNQTALQLAGNLLSSLARLWVSKGKHGYSEAINGRMGGSPDFQ
jgi:hypothetical protein